MAKQRHIGLVLFAVCSALSARIALFEPKPQEPTAAELRWGTTQKEHDHFGFLKGLRYYIYGVGVLGLLIVAEDYVGEKLRKKNGLKPTPPDSAAPSDQQTTIR